MRLGVIARAEARGLGIQTLEVVRHLDPERILYVRPQPEGWVQNSEWYAGYNVTTAIWRRGRLNEELVRRWLDGLDVVYTAETPYDPRLPFWAEAAGCALVRHANPEQLGPDEWLAHDPTVWWAATTWRIDKLPIGTQVVPMPVATDRFRDRPRPDGPTRFLHSIGHVAQDDRAGSRIVARAAHKVPWANLTVNCQSRRLDVPFPQHVKLNLTGVRDYWDQYKDQDVLVLPRRYGGLSLPTQEALAAGMAVIMTDCPPNHTWPGPKVEIAKVHTVHMRCGEVNVYDPDHHDLATLIEHLASDPEELHRLQTEAREWATKHSWDALRPLWMMELARACRSSSPGSVATTTASTLSPG